MRKVVVNATPLIVLNYVRHLELDGIRVKKSETKWRRPCIKRIYVMER